MKLYLDIETIPTQRQDVREYIAAGVTHPGNISKAETIAKWNEENRPAAIEEAVQKTGLDGAFGQICVIGWAFGDDPVKTLHDATDEAEILQAFCDALSYIPAKEIFQTSVIGHNVSSFDLRFLMQRFIVNGIMPPSVIERSAQAKPWETDKVFDTMVQWSGVGNRVSLDKLCLALSIESPKGDLDGSKVGQYVKDGRIAEVVDYCKDDVEAVRKVYQRMTFQHITQVADLQTA